MGIARKQPQRREFFRWVAAGILSPAACSLAGGAIAALGGRRAQAASPDLRKDWLARWEKNILQDARNRYCDREMGEEIGWLVSPFLNGFYYGYLATHDGKWADLPGRLGRRLDPPRGEGAGRLPRLAEGRRRQHHRHARPATPTTFWARRWGCVPWSSWPTRS